MCPMPKYYFGAKVEVNHKVVPAVSNLQTGTLKFEILPTFLYSKYQYTFYLESLKHIFA